MAEAHPGGGIKAGLVLHHELHLSPPATHRTVAPIRYMECSTLPDTIGDAQPLRETQGNQWEQLFLFIIIDFNHGRQNLN